jgi:hypothetical protein
LLVSKEIIRPGTYSYIDEDTGLPAKYEATPAEVHRLFNDGKAMLADGLSIPVPLEHQLEALPMTKAQRAAQMLRDNAGWVTGYEVRDIVEKGETVKDVLFGQVDIQDPEIAKKAPGTIKWTSPWIKSFTDGNGKNWNGVITHLALTTRPRITKQQPFTSMAAALSLLPHLKPQTTFPKGLALSRAGLVQDNKPLYPMAFSLWTGIRLAEDEMPPKKDKSKEKPEAKRDDKAPPSKPGEKPHGAEHEEQSGTPMEPADDMTGLVPESLVDGDGDISVYDVICDLFEALEPPIMIESGDESNFHERVYNALMNHIKQKSTMGDPMAEPKPPETPKAPGQTNPIIQEQPPLMMSANMSLEEAQKLPDPATRSVALSMIALRNNLFKNAQDKRQERVNRILKRMPKEAADALKLQLANPGIKFALGDDGAVIDPMAPMLDILEKAIVDVPMLLQAPNGKFTVEPHPKEQAADEVTPERLAEITAEAMKAAHVKPDAAAGAA